MTSIVVEPETGISPNYTVPTDLRYVVARNGILRALGASPSVQIDKLLFKVQLRSHNKWILSHETYRHLEKKTMTAHFDRNVARN